MYKWIEESIKDYEEMNKDIRCMDLGLSEDKVTETLNHKGF